MVGYIIFLTVLLVQSVTFAGDNRKHIDQIYLDNEKIQPESKISGFLKRTSSLLRRSVLPMCLIGQTVSGQLTNVSNLTSIVTNLTTLTNKLSSVTAITTALDPVTNITTMVPSGTDIATIINGTTTPDFQTILNLLKTGVIPVGFLFFCCWFGCCCKKRDDQQNTTTVKEVEHEEKKDDKVIELEDLN